MERDALRYRFLRDKDAFGDENEPGLASWDDLAEMEYNEFDAAVDARMNDSDMPLYIITQGQIVENDVAASEKKASNERYKQISDIDYLGAMNAFHSDEWHKMGPITAYMHGFNARGAAMLQGAEPVTTGYKLPDQIKDNQLNSGPDADDYYSGYQAGWNELLEAVSGNYPVAQDGWIPVSERMPPQYQEIIFWIKNQLDGNRCVFGKYSYESQSFMYFERIVEDGYDEDQWVYVDGVTHWMPITAPQQGNTLYVRADVVSGNSPVIQDGWVIVPVDMTPEQMRAVQLKSELGSYAAANLSGAYALFRAFWDVAVAAAPQYGERK
ncbi:DUF551 domain-containing protein [Enterobacter bugandensis]|uniref:DUF551 domain-containing protein n=1 Tax=Enterobacter bugandensis TaxID=881260 RepID=UPI000796510A|nr:DUF551 domain-containing protein [Enterobacter bugandensis]SAH66037.1 Protein of uncharacterised function (DUF551) [Enterobacter bugandensis]